MKLIMTLTECFNPKPSSDLIEIVTRPTLIFDIILTIIMGASFITWHHGIIVGTGTLILGIILNQFLNVTGIVIYWVIIGIFHPILYRIGTAQYNDTRQKIETSLMVVMILIVSIL